VLTNSQPEPTKRGENRERPWPPAPAKIHQHVAAENQIHRLRIVGERRIRVLREVEIFKCDQFLIRGRISKRWGPTGLNTLPSATREHCEKTSR